MSRNHHYTSLQIVTVRSFKGQIQELKDMVNYLNQPDTGRGKKKEKGGGGMMSHLLSNAAHQTTDILGFLRL